MALEKVFNIFNFTLQGIVYTQIYNTTFSLTLFSMGHSAGAELAVFDFASFMSLLCMGHSDGIDVCFTDVGGVLGIWTEEPLAPILLEIYIAWIGETEIGSSQMYCYY